MPVFADLHAAALAAGASMLAPLLAVNPAAAASAVQGGVVPRLLAVLARYTAGGEDVNQADSQEASTLPYEVSAASVLCQF